VAFLATTLPYRIQLWLNYPDLQAGSALFTPGSGTLCFVDHEVAQPDSSSRHAGKHDTTGMGFNLRASSARFPGA
jgi:hypothetical protein